MVLDPEDDASALVWLTQRSFGWGGEAVLQNWPFINTFWHGSLGL